MLLESAIFVVVFAFGAITGRRQVWAPAAATPRVAAHAFDD